MRLRWCATVLLAAGAFAQRPWIGIKAGVPASDAFRGDYLRKVRYYPESGRYVLGPTIEVPLPLRLSVELDLLYRSLQYRSENAVTDLRLQTQAAAWCIPLLGKFRLSDRWVTPYLAAGLAFERLSNLRQTGTILSGTLPRTPTEVNTDEPFELQRRFTYGYVFGVGLEGRLPLVRISPELRYTRWQRDTFLNLETGQPLNRRSQLELLVGIVF